MDTSHYISRQAVKNKDERSSHLQQHKGNLTNIVVQLQEANVVFRMQQLVIDQGIGLSVKVS
jgi:hypothetical protein